MQDFGELPPIKEVRFKIETGSATLAKKDPYHNEDAHFCLKNIAGVFDGVGGRQGGENASGIACEYLKSSLSKEEYLRGQFFLPELKDFISQKMNKVNRLIYKAGQEDSTNAATTATLAFVRKNEKGVPYVLFANVGDSRGYILRQGTFFQITSDDNEIKDIFGESSRGKEVQDRLNRAKHPADLSEDEFLLFRNRNKISQALGKVDIKTNFYTAILQEGDTIVLCTDGVSDNLATGEMERAVRGLKDPQRMAKSLVDTAARVSRQGKSISFRSKPDDITALAIRLGP